MHEMHHVTVTIVWDWQGHVCVCGMIVCELLFICARGLMKMEMV